MIFSGYAVQRRHPGGFSLLELVFALLVLAVLVQVALPMFQDEVDRAKLAELEMLVGQREIIFVVDVSGSMHGTPLSMCKDAMRTAMKSAHAEGDYSMYHVKSPAPGVMPAEYAGLSIEDSLQYPGLSLMMAPARSHSSSATALLASREPTASLILISS